MSAGCHELPASTRGYCCWPTFEIPRGTDAHSGAARWFGGRIPAHRFDSIPVLRVTTVNPFKRRGRHHEISAVIGERGRSTQPSAVRIAARTERNGAPARAPIARNFSDFVARSFRPCTYLHSRHRSIRGGAI
jgi:hypothetical protein